MNEAELTQTVSSSSFVEHLLGVCPSSRTLAGWLKRAACSPGGSLPVICTALNVLHVKHERSDVMVERIKSYGENMMCCVRCSGRQGDGRCCRTVNSLILNTLGQEEALGELCPLADGLVR